MLLNRLGNKRKLLPAILPLFPRNIVSFLDLFAGSLSVSVAMLDRAKYLIANDLDADVANLFHVWRTRPAELADALSIVPYHSHVLSQFKRENEADPLWRAVAFIYKSNFTLMSKGETLKLGQGSPRQITLQAIREGFERISRIQFMSCDFRECLSKICWRHERDKGQAFIYSDPPYVSCENTYNAPAWTAQDTQDLFALLSSSGLRFAVSEFDNPLVLELAAKHGLTVTSLGERRNIGNRRVEILVTNYPTQPAQPSLFLPSTTQQVAAGRDIAASACL